VGKTTQTKPETAARFRVYVKRGAQTRFEQLTRESGGLPVLVEWDRRAAERRNASEAPGADVVGLTPRAGDRRTAPSFDARQTGFVVVAEPDDDEAA
jgi:hypothetical protein